MSTHVLLNLLNEACQAFYLFFLNKFNKFNFTGAGMLDSIYLMTLN